MKTLQSLNVSIESWFELTEDITLPIFIDIASIKEYKNNIENLKMDIQRSDFRLNKEEDPFEKERKEYSIKEEIKRSLQFIDNRKMYGGKTYIQEYFEVDDADQLLDLLINSGIQMDILIRLKIEISYYIERVKFKFLVNAKEVLDYDRQFRTIVLKQETPEDIAKHSQYSQEMSKIQSSMEYNDSIIFPENIGKSFIEYSWREIYFKVLYISMKNKIEGFMNKYKQHEIEKK